MRLRFLTAGESHGQGLVGILEGLPAGLHLDASDIDHQLKRRQAGYGRGGRMKIEKDRIKLFTGVRHGYTLGSPVSFIINNKDWKNWQTRMAVDPVEKDIRRITMPRPGHADFVGVHKYRFNDIRNVIERSSARETAMRVAVCSMARQFLENFGIYVASHVYQIGHAALEKWELPEDISAFNEIVDKSPVRCLDADAGEQMMREIDRAKAKGDSVGGLFEVVVDHVPIGLGSYVHWDRKLESQLAAAMLSIPAVKGVEIGDGFENAKSFGSEVHDEIFYEKDKGYYRRTNRAGGLEGGVTNGERIIVRGAMKPIPTLTRPLMSVDMETKEAVSAHRERSDTCSVPPCAVVAEAVVAFVIANVFIEKFGGDSMAEIEERYQQYLSDTKKR